MRVLLFLSLFVSSFSMAQDLDKLRAEYPKANSEEAVTNVLFEKLSAISKDDSKTLVAYKGALATLKAKYASGFRNKKDYFKMGAELLDYAVKTDPKNIEIRCLRLGVQENAPKIVGYKKNIDEDRQFILDHYASNKDNQVRKFVKGYVLLSEEFSEAEKQLF